MVFDCFDEGDSQSESSTVRSPQWERPLKREMIRFFTSVLFQVNSLKSDGTTSSGY
jgi:hypothetical protein